jgi:methyl-accepting chemotaxis protein
VLNPFASRDGLARTVFAIVGLWGLLAGLMLVRTLLVTKQLHGRVTAITGSVSTIDRELDAIKLMEDTNRISTEILAAAQPLPELLGEMQTVSGGMEGKVNSILAGSLSIEEKSRAIEAAVREARDTAGSINATTRSIAATVAGVNETLRSTKVAAGEINGTAKGLNGSVAALLEVTKGIDAGIARSNQGIQSGYEIFVAIRNDIGNILAGLPEIQRHARSIDCTGLLGLLGSVGGRGTACE